MNAVSPICLTDLVPALYWSRPGDVAPVLRHSRLIDGWWRSLPVTRVVDIAGAAWLSHSLARLAIDHWEHLRLAEFVPSLQEIPVDPDEVAEPVRGAILATAGSWERLITATPAAMRSWGFSSECGDIDVIGTVMWRAVHPFTRDTSGSPLPSPGLVIEAVRTIAHWLPDSAPAHVHNALAYLSSATGASGTDTEAADPSADADTEPPQTPATRAIRTLRALRAQRDEGQHQEPDTEAEAPRADAAPDSGTGPVSSRAPARPGGLASRSRSPLMGPDRTLRRPSFGRPRETRQEETEHEAPELREHPLVALLEELFRSWEGVERTVAAERLFATDPVSIRVLADQLRVDVSEIRNAQRSVEERLLNWLGSPAGAPVTEHLRDLSERLGTAATIDHLINAHQDHPVEVPSLGTPLWRVLITLFTERRLHNGWLVSDDPHLLRWKTRESLGDAPSLTDAEARLGRLGIRQQALRAWLLSTPGVSIRDGHVLVDPSTPMETPAQVPAYGGHADVHPESSSATTANGLPIRRRPSEDAEEPHEHEHEPASTESVERATMPSVIMSARCFRAPDGRWWHRVDVSSDHLNGAPVTVPPGYATHLGLQPGRLLCLTAPGADLLVLVWRDQPAFDSLRPLLRRLSAQPGDRVFITVEHDRLDARRLPAADLADHGPTSRALHLIGYTAPASTDEALRIISNRIREETSDGPVDPKTLMELLAQRGDEDLIGELRPGLSVPH
ncbi:hypothetical protein F4561_003212 [Lipingzhangella halophila]|uniref:Uncharacterized protein n=1 Tax=Lipingzhangella halophila TaxID=1783352 RepID=A0A7W7RI93_9ACTN|nr:hypothetical protein [Lipingzhangella halophila]MBB4932392.1 hypothetical protein [Lipingzhangella halophila]